MPRELKTLGQGSDNRLDASGHVFADRLLPESQNGPAVCGEVSVFSGIRRSLLRGAVPVFAIGFDGDVSVKNREVDAESTDAVFRHEGDPRARQAIPQQSFDIRRPVDAPAICPPQAMTGSGTKPSSSHGGPFRFVRLAAFGAGHQLARSLGVFALPVGDTETAARAVTSHLASHGLESCSAVEACRLFSVARFQGVLPSWRPVAAFRRAPECGTVADSRRRNGKDRLASDAPAFDASRIAGAWWSRLWVHLDLLCRAAVPSDVPASRGLLAAPIVPQLGGQPPC